MDEKIIYEALPTHQQQEFDRVYQQAEQAADELRTAMRRYESLCAAMQDAIDRAESTDAVGAPGSREPAGQYA